MDYSNMVYPPIIDANLPPITAIPVYKKKEGTNEDLVDANGKKIINYYDYTFTLPLTYNRFNSPSQIIGCRLRIISAVTGKLMIEGLNAFFDGEEKDTLNFNIPKDKNWIIKNYYKVQAAFIFRIGENEYYSSYSTFGITKIIDPSEMIVDIGGLESGSVENTAKGRYIGEFFISDQSERVKEYKFLVYNTVSEEPFFDTGWLIHDNSTNFVNNIGQLCGRDFFDAYLILNDLEDYIIQYKIKTLSNYEKESDKKTIINFYDFPSKINCNLIAKENFITNSIDIYMKGIEQGGTQELVTGEFILLRSEQDLITKEWDIPYEVLKIYMYDTTPSTQIFVGEENNQIIKWKDRLIWQDYTAAHGVLYKYYLQQVWQGTNALTTYYSEMIVSNEIQSAFEDASLYDGEKQLIIKYNPKIANFKTTKIDTKQDTIGSKYPFIFRGANTNYKEFTISGLISYTGDELGSFNPKYALKEFQRKETPILNFDFQTQPYDLTAENFSLERQFKLEVLDWLNDGKVKLFRSPSEGNYLVRLMNISLTPNDTLGRMLHTFSCTAYEVADFSPTTMIDKSILTQKKVEFKDYKIIEADFVKINNTNSFRYPASGVEYFNHIRIPVNFKDVIDFYRETSPGYYTLDFHLVAGERIYNYDLKLDKKGYFEIMPQTVTGQHKIFYDTSIPKPVSTPTPETIEVTERKKIICSQIREDSEKRENHEGHSIIRVLKSSTAGEIASAMQNNINDICNTFKFYTLRFETNYFKHTGKRMVERNGLLFEEDVDIYDEFWTEEDCQIFVNDQVINLKSAKYYQLPNSQIPDLTNITYLAIGPGVTLTWSGRQWLGKKVQRGE